MRPGGRSGAATLPIHIRQSGFSNLQFGWLMSINGLMIFALQLPMTHWLSRFPAMSVLESGGLLISIGFVLNRYGPRALWIGTFGVALTAVAIYCMIHRTITQRVEDGEHE